MAKKPMDDHYFRIDEKSNAIDSLQKAVVFLSKTKNDQFYWKWFIVAIHHAIYHFMLFALQNSDLSGVWADDKYLNTIGLKEGKLIDFKEAFDLVQKKEQMTGYINAKPFVAKNEHKKAIKTLNDNLRNPLIHYRPISWSIEIDYIISVVLPLLEIITFLINESGRIRAGEDEVVQINKNIMKITAVLKSLGNKHK